jgi:hypothetical protein
MRRTDAEPDKIECLMRQASVSGPSEVLKARVTEAMRNAWPTDSNDVPARVLLRRLAISAAAATVLVGLVEQYCDRVVSQGRPVFVGTATREPVDLMVPLESAYPKMARHLVAGGRARSEIDASMIQEYVERVHEALDEGRKDGPSSPSTGPRGQIWSTPVPESYS